MDIVDRYTRPYIKSIKWLLENKQCVGVSRDNEEQSLRGYKPWPMKNMQCLGVSRDQWKTNIAWVKERGHVGRTGVLRLFKVMDFGCSEFRQPLRVCELSPIALRLHTSVIVGYGMGK